MQTMPGVRPKNARFSSGPCAKRPGWQLQTLSGALLGRSHRATEGKERLKLAIDTTKTVLGIPADYLVGIVPGSDTGAFEMAMWTMLGARGVDALAWESFGKGWVTDAIKQLKLENCRVIEADYGALPDLAQVEFDRDVLFTANGTTSGVRIPDYDWIPADRAGLTFVDATSAAFAQPVDWAKVDVLTFSWQKVLGGEAAHGMIVLSPRAVERLEAYQPSWPLPKVFRLTKAGKVDRAIFAGETINTPSMLCVEDYLDALAWAQSVGGLPALIQRANRNSAIIFDWIERTPWISNLAVDPRTRSTTSVSLAFSDPRLRSLSSEAQRAFAKAVARTLEEQGVAFDVASHRDAPPGLRIWTGSTIEASDVAALLPWIDWAYAVEMTRLSPS